MVTQKSAKFMLLLLLIYLAFPSVAMSEGLNFELTGGVGDHGDTVKVIFRMTNSEPVEGYQAIIKYMGTVFSIIEVSEEFASAATADYFKHVRGGDGAESWLCIGFIVDFDEDPTSEVIPPGVSRDVAAITFRISTDASPGKYSVDFDPGPVVPSVFPVMNLASVRGQDVFPSLLQGTEIGVRPDPPSDLICTGSKDKIELSWQNPSEYDEIRVYRSGDMVASVDGSSESYEEEAGEASCPVFQVSGVQGGVESRLSHPSYSLCFVRGDTDGNGVYTIGDGIQILERLFSGREAYGSNCEDAGDVDDNGVLTIGDAIWLFNYLFAEGTAPAAPFPTCGPDPTPDDPFDCRGYPTEQCPCDGQIHDR